MCKLISGRYKFPITHNRSLLFQDNLSVCYSKTTNLIAYKPLFIFNSAKNEEVDEVRIIDITGEIVFERETKMASSRIAISNNGNYLAYFFRGGYDSNYRLKVIDLRTMVEVADFKAINDGIKVYFTFDDKYIVVGYQNGLTMHNLETLKTTVVFESSTSISIVSPKDYLKTLYWNLSDYKFYKLSLPLTSINQEQNKQEISIYFTDNKLILTNPQNHQTTK